ncbi:hypothetical protein F511_19532 [Dorcoceras hygrometricum]|uniref:Uncharacterized protein n=1 Tax=Dorcoceras hygrometricum TaxID=472368 RepID=A0A2Z7ADM8_9LAMI|nr:hypothetical protein F511_19532 [Dorcoceras hygrometricum]
MVVDLIGIYVLKGPYPSTPCAAPSLLYLTTVDAPPRASAPRHHDRTCSDRLFEEFPSVPNSSGLLVQADEGLVFSVVDLIRRIYRCLHLKSQIPCEFGWSQAPRRQQVVKKTRTTTGKAASKKRDLGLVSVAPEAVPIQMIEPISIVPAERPPAPKRNTLKRNFRMPADSSSSSTSSSHNLMDSRVNSPMNEETSANQIDFLVDTPVDGETPVTQIFLPSVDTTDEIQALEKDFTDFQQKTESGIAHGESSSRSPQPPPDDKSRRGGSGSRSRGDRSGYSSIRHSSSSEPHGIDVRYCPGEK